MVKEKDLSGLIVHTTTIIPALGRQRQRDNEFGNSLGYIVRILEKCPDTKEEKNNSSTTFLVAGLHQESLDPSGMAPLW